MLPPWSDAAGGLATLTQKIVLARFTPACVVINRKHEILFLYGNTSDYLVQPTGELIPDLLAWAREGLAARLRVAIREAVTLERPAIATVPQYRDGESFSRVRITVEPLKVPKEAEGLLLVVFEAVLIPEPIETAYVADSGYASQVLQLEYELKATREELQSSIELLESANGELRAVNEELMSMNEEFQSTNEELETSKEELQSLNEELATVNSQLEAKILEVEETSNDLENLLVSTDLATVFLDRELRIKRFTPATARLLQLRAADVGRPMSDFAMKVSDQTLLADAASVLDTELPIECTIQGKDQCFIRRILPYQADGRVEGVVVTFSDITESQRNKDALQTTKDWLTTILEALPVASFTCKAGGDFATTHISENVIALTGFASEDFTSGATFWSDRIHPEDAADVLGRLPSLLDQGTLECSYRWRTKDGTHRWFYDFMRVVRHADGSASHIVGMRQDVSARKQFEAELEVLNESVIERSTLAASRADQLRAMSSELHLVEQRERRRLAEAVHDDLVQILSAAAIKLATARNTARDSELHVAMGEVKDHVDQAIQTARALTFELSPLVLHELGFDAALDWLAEEMERLFDLEVSITDDGQSKPLAEGVKVTVFRATRELLTNVAKHAAVKVAQVVVRRHDDQLVLMVVDHGKGFDATAPRDHGFGMFSIGERMGYVGGEIEIESSPGAGTTATIRAPLFTNGGRGARRS
jgi:two-component system CheB/CheR fusion protein